MRLKSFYAKTMTEAMQMVRDTLGEDAIIIATQEERGGKAVRVTAAIEPAFELGRGGAATGEDWLQYDDEQDEAATAEQLTDAMLRHGVPEEVMDQILSCAAVVGMDQPNVALIAALEHLYSYDPLPQKPVQRAQMLIGPPGSGKTLAAAKMATRGVMDGLKIGVVTCDSARAGGFEQLQAFTRLLRLDLHKASEPQELRAVITDMGGYDQIIIDTAGLNPFDTEDVKTLARLINAAPLDPVLVLPAGGDADESGEIARVAMTIGAHSLLPTRVDIARRLGGLLAAAHYGKLSFADMSNTAKVAEGLTPLQPKLLAQLLMPEAFRNSHPARTAAMTRTGTRQ